MSENLRDRYAEVVYAWYVVGIPGVTAWSDLNNDDRETWCSLADAVLAVRDDVLAEKDAEIERLTSERDKAREECGHEKAMRAHLREELNTFVRLATERKSRAEAAEPELERLRETVGRVEALAEGPTSDSYRPYAVRVGDDVHLAVLLDDLRAALAPRPSASEAPRTRDDEQGGER